MNAPAASPRAHSRQVAGSASSICDNKPALHWRGGTEWVILKAPIRPVDGEGSLAMPDSVIGVIQAATYPACGPSRRTGVQPFTVQGAVK